MNIKKICDSLNIKEQCRSFGVGLWQCPRFLFLVMAAIVVLSIFITYETAQQYVEEPQITALIVLVVAALIFVIGHIIVASFERVAIASKAKSEFASIMSHQLRTPLSEIKWQLNMLLEKNISAGNIEAQTFFSHLEESNQKMIHMVNDFLDLNRVEDNNLYLVPISFSLGEIVRKVVERRKKVLEGSNISIEIQELKDLPNVFADEVKIREVISNLLDNAIRYSGYDGRNGKITIILEKKSRYVQCSIKDEGIGISKEDAKMVFSKFFRAGSAIKYQTQGLGLRLFLSKAFVKASGGKIGFSSEEGKGSIFWFTVPIFCAKQ